MRRFQASALLALAVSTASFVPCASAADDARIAKAVQAVQGWNYGEDAGELNYLQGEAVSAAREPAARRQMEKVLIAGLAGAKTRPGKAFFCRQLVLVGSEAAVPGLAGLLSDPEDSHIARYALQRIEGRAADEALLKALGSVDEKLKVGMVYSLGQRRCAAAVDRIIPLLASGNDDLVVASLVALSRMPTPQAVDALAKARQAANEKVRHAATDAYLDCAAALAAAGKKADALAIYQKLFQPNEPTMCRIGALRGLVAAAAGPEATSLAVNALADKDPKVREAAIPTLRAVPGQAVTGAITALLAKVDAPVRVQLLAVLADRGDRSALPAVLKAADSDSPPVRLAALDALAALGDASVVPMLAERAATAEGREEQQAARGSLERLSRDGVDGAIVKAMGAAKPAVRVELVRALAVRKAAGAMPAVLKAAKDEAPEVRTEAMRALRTLAGPKDVPTLVRFLTEVRDGAVRPEAENAVVAAARQIDDAQAPAAAPLAALRSAAEPAVKASLIRVLGRIGHAAALPALTAAANGADADVKDAAIRALADWPTAAPAAALLAVAEDASASPTHRILALRGYVGMIHKQEDRTDDQILADYAKALALASRNEDKQLVLSRLAGLRHRGALEIAQRCREDQALKGAAEAAIRKIEQLLAAPAAVTASHKPEAAANAIDGKADTRWDTGGAMQGGEWFKIDLGEAQLITAIVLDTRGSGGDYPRGYEVYISPSTLGQGKLVAQGKGSGPVTEIKLPKGVVGKTIKIVQTGRMDGLHWSIHELTVKAQPVPR
ncbi:MAG TPA: HEAT repeat domain-containing protein [Phycisphaerae bacterium]|nr:HEAT repeat domain-containing protein [Phycisphaerae bacterium]